MEAKAVLNLLKMSDTVVGILASAAATYGVQNGPVNHTALAADILLDSFEADVPVKEFKVKMKNNHQTCLRLAERSVQDYVACPVQMRRTMNVDMLTTFQKSTRCFELCLEEFAKKVSHKLFLSELVSLNKSFDQKFMDDILVMKADACEDPIDLMSIPEFRSILVRVNSAEQQDRATLHTHTYLPTYIYTYIHRHAYGLAGLVWVG
jgi:hypothetical protein